MVIYIINIFVKKLTIRPIIFYGTLLIRCALIIEPNIKNIIFHSNSAILIGLCPVLANGLFSTIFTW